MRTKKCINCSKVFTKPTYVSIPNWETRRFCSHGCGHEFSKKETEKSRLSQTKVCIVCNNTFCRKDGQSHKQRAACKHCCKQCNTVSFGMAGSAYNKGKMGIVPLEKQCVTCGKYYGKHGRTGKSWLNAINCSQECAVIYRQQQPYKESRRLKLISNGKGYNNRRMIVLARDNFTCQICAYREPLIMQVDHKVQKAHDPDKATSLNNLWTLCPNCHAKKTLKYSNKLDELIPRVELLQNNKQFLDKLLKDN